mmetsp:Transcript_5347/g.12063  ORF Transcript_5347/g.12063 Transcript_5347/m.12063 type:complete len:323 (-) Transcript_5347:727-1695(-)
MKRTIAQPGYYLLFAASILLPLVVEAGGKESTHKFIDYCSRTPSDWITVNDCEEGKRPHLFSIEVESTSVEVQPDVYMALVSPLHAQCEYGTCRADEDGGYDVVVGEECVGDKDTQPRQAHFVDSGHAVSRQITISHNQEMTRKRYYVRLIPKESGACSFKLSRGALFAEKKGYASCNEIVAVDEHDASIADVRSCGELRLLLVLPSPLHAVMPPCLHAEQYFPLYSSFVSAFVLSTLLFVCLYSFISLLSPLPSPLSSPFSSPFSSLSSLTTSPPLIPLLFALLITSSLCKQAVRRFQPGWASYFSPRFAPSPSLSQLWWG